MKIWVIEYTLITFVCDFWVDSTPSKPKGKIIALPKGECTGHSLQDIGLLCSLPSIFIENEESPLRNLCGPTRVAH